MFDESVIEQFWSNVNKDGPTMPHMQTPCWVWVGPKIKKGYGYLNLNSRIYLVHRFSWVLESGEIPDDLFVCHHCDNRTCVNLDHLFLGTNADNMIDAYSKGRVTPPSLSGERNSRAKLTADDVLRIREMRAQGMKLSDIATVMGVGRHCIGLVVNLRRWGHVK